MNGRMNGNTLVADHWDLSVLFDGPLDPDIRKTMAVAKTNARDLTSRYAFTTPLPEMVSSFVLSYFEDINSLAIFYEPLWVYSYLAYSGDQLDNTKEKLYNSFEKFQGEMLEITKPALETITKLVSCHGEELLAAESLIPYRYYMERLLLEHRYEHYHDDPFGIYECSKWQDKVISTRKIALEGNSLTWKEGRKWLASSDPRDRYLAIKHVLEGLTSGEKRFTSCLVNICRSHLDKCHRHGYSNPLESVAVADGISTGFINSLAKISLKNAGVYRDFIRLKARLLGDEVLKGEDLLAPLPVFPGGFNNWNELTLEVKELYRDFDSVMGKIVEEAFDNKQFDAVTSAGKKDRRFTLAWHGSQKAFAMLTYTGIYDDLLTTVHEAGHVAHFTLMAKHQPYLIGHPSNIICEIAAEFGNLLLWDRIKREEKRPLVKAARCLKIVEKMAFHVFDYGMMRYQFEKDLFRLIAREEETTADRITALYRDSVDRFYGDAAVFMPVQYRYWMVTPVLYSVFRRFDNYPFAAAVLLATVMMEKYRSEGVSFTRDYRIMLEAGASLPPEKLLSLAGIEAGEKTWQRGFTALERMVGEVEEMTAGIN